MLTCDISAQEQPAVPSITKLFISQKRFLNKEFKIMKKNLLYFSID
jgi:hypothetical protein